MDLIWVMSLVVLAVFMTVNVYAEKVTKPETAQQSKKYIEQQLSVVAINTAIMSTVLFKISLHESGLILEDWNNNSAFALFVLEFGVVLYAILDCVGRIAKFKSLENSGRKNPRAQKANVSNQSGVTSSAVSEDPSLLGLPAASQTIEAKALKEITHSSDD